MNCFLRAALASAAVFAACVSAQAEIAYTFNGVHNRERPQAGFNYSFIGDDVTLPAGPGYLLNSIDLRFGLLRYDDHHYEQSGISAFTPSIDLLVFAIDPSSRLPIGSPLATSTVNNQTFQVAEVPFAEADAGDPQFFTNPNLKNVTFDFSAANLTLPTDFGFAYHVTGGLSADADNIDEMNFFSSIASDSVDTAATPGTTQYGTLVAYPNDGIFAASKFAFNGSPAANDQAGINWSVNSNMIATVNATAVPEPGTFVLMGLGVLALFFARKKLAA